MFSMLKSCSHAGLSWHRCCMNIFILKSYNAVSFALHYEHILSSVYSCAARMIAQKHAFFTIAPCAFCLTLRDVGD